MTVPERDPYRTSADPEKGLMPVPEKLVTKSAKGMKRFVYGKPCPKCGWIELKIKWYEASESWTIEKWNNFVKETESDPSSIGFFLKYYRVSDNPYDIDCLSITCKRCEHWLGWHKCLDAPEEEK